ncbi:MAG: hypothetical protein ACJA13_000738 [Paraglaciecola sp.]
MCSGPVDKIYPDQTVIYHDSRQGDDPANGQETDSVTQEQVTDYGAHYAKRMTDIMISGWVLYVLMPNMASLVMLNFVNLPLFIKLTPLALNILHAFCSHIKYYQQWY